MLNGRNKQDAVLAVSQDRFFVQKPVHHIPPRDL